MSKDTKTNNKGNEKKTAVQPLWLNPRRAEYPTSCAVIAASAQELFASKCCLTSDYFDVYAIWNSKR